MRDCELTFDVTSLVRWDADDPIFLRSTHRLQDAEFSFSYYPIRSAMARSWATDGTPHKRTHLGWRHSPVR